MGSPQDNSFNQDGTLRSIPRDFKKNGKTYQFMAAPALSFTQLTSIRRAQDALGNDDSGVPKAKQPHTTSSQSTSQSNQPHVKSQIEHTSNVRGYSADPQPKRQKVAHSIMPQMARYKPEADMALQKAANQMSAKLETVDLTQADNNPSPVTQPPKTEEVCLGMVGGAMICCHTVPSPRPNSYALGGDACWPLIKVNLKHPARGSDMNQIMVYDCTGRVFGEMDPKTTAGLLCLIGPPIHVRTYCRIPIRRKIPDERAGQSIDRSYKCELMLYGPRHRAAQIGEMLSEKSITLVSPTRVDAGIKTLNPHAAENLAKAPADQSNRRVLGGTFASAGRHAQFGRPHTDEQVRADIKNLFDSLHKSEDLPEVSTDARIVTPLMKHQRQALWFMLNREKVVSPADGRLVLNPTWQERSSSWYVNIITGDHARSRPRVARGGILADMMGLGKTLSILALVVSTSLESHAWAGLPPQKPCVLGQWQADVCDISRNVKSTLLVCPLSAISNWEDQIKTHIRPGVLKYYIHHGTHKVSDPTDLSGYDIVLTTYGHVAAELKDKNSGNKQRQLVLGRVGWFRIVLDEAHVIREQSTQQCKAVCLLQAYCRWAVTGTPIQNRLDDLGSLFAFLRLSPFDEKGKFKAHIALPFERNPAAVLPKLRVLIDFVTLRRLKDKIHLPPRTDLDIHLKFSADEQKLYDVLRDYTLDRIRTVRARPGQANSRALMHVLTAILRVRRVCAHGKDLLSDTDLAAAQGLMAEAAIDDEDVGCRMPLSEARAQELFRHMRESNSDHCCHCDKKLGSNETEAGELEENPLLGYITPCFHVYCPTCIEHFCDATLDLHHYSNALGSCPVCHHPVFFLATGLRRDDTDLDNSRRGASSPTILSRYTGPHTKTRALVAELQQLAAESARSPSEPPLKAVVFSLWTSHLDLIQRALTAAHIPSTRLDGTLSAAARAHVLHTFRGFGTAADHAPEHPRVLLATIGAGGVGLNLTAASAVYVMEPSYNPAAEDQAIDRVHRLGQRRPVRTVRFIMEGSVEERLVDLQVQKRQIAALSMDDDKTLARGGGDAIQRRLAELEALLR